MFNKRSSSAWWYVACLVALAVIAFFPWLGSVHLFDWDEINFAEAAREMLVTGNYSQVQINFEPFYEKPPFFFWLQALSMQMWGINEFAARFPNALFGVFTLLTLYLMGKREMNSRFGLLWALTHLSALLPHFYFKTGIIDPVFNYFIFLGVYGLARLLDKQASHTTTWAWIGGLSIGLAILTKGPVGALMPALVGLVYLLSVRRASWQALSLRVVIASPKKAWQSKSRGKGATTPTPRKPTISWYAFSILSIAAIIPPLAWLGYETYHHGIDFIKNFIIYQIELFNQPVAGHGQPFYYHFVVVFLGCFPASVLALGSLFKSASIAENKLLPMMKILFWVVMILFSLSTTKIVHYSSMAYFPISFLAACYLYQIDRRTIRPLSELNILASGKEGNCEHPDVIANTVGVWQSSRLRNQPDGVSGIIPDTTEDCEQFSDTPRRQKMILGKRSIVASRAMQVALWVVGCLIALIFTALPILALHKSWLRPFITDSFTLASIDMPVPWGISDCVVGVSYGVFNLIAFYFFKKRSILSFAGCCVIATTCCLTFGTLRIIPKIEMHTQRPAIELYKKLVGESAYVTTVGFKSYAPLFYFQQPPATHVRSSELSWLMSGQLDYPAYFVVKIGDISQLSPYPAIKLLYIQGGFAFFKREKDR